MSKIEVNKEEFLDKYADYVNKINSIGSELTNDCDFGVIKNSSEVVNAFVLAYQDLYFAVRKAKLVMIKDWVAFRMCIEELDLFDSYLAASLSGAPGSGNAATEMAKYLSGVLLNSSVSLETELANIGDDCCYPEVSNVCFVTIRSDNNINLIDAIVPRLESVISGCEEYYNKIMELRSEISSVVSCKTSDNFISYMCNTQPSIVQKLMTIASEFKEDLLDYEQAYRYKLPDEGTFTLKYDELSDASEDIDSMIESLRTTLSDANTINANVSRLPSYPNVAIKPSTLGTQYAYESICDYLTNARRRLNGILDVIDETENEFINLVNEDLSSDISILKTYLDTQCDKDISSVCFTAVNFTSRYTLPNYEELSALSGIRNEEDLYVDESNGFDYYFNRLYDENGDLIDANYEDFKEYLNRMGVDSSIVDNDMLAGINIYMSHLESLGYSRETAQQIIAEIVVADATTFTSLNHVPYDAQLAIMSNMDNSISGNFHKKSSYVIPALTEWVTNACNDNDYYYSFGGWGPGSDSDELGIPGGYDCGHFVTAAMYASGIFTSSDRPFPASVDCMEDYYCSHGFDRVPFDINDLQPGDVLIRVNYPGAHDHAAIYLGNDEYGHASTSNAAIANQVLISDINENWSFVLRYQG